MAARFLLPALALACCGAADAAQSVYRYQDDEGRWHYSDRPPGDGRSVEVRALQPRLIEPQVLVSEVRDDDTIVLMADNQFHCPVEFEIELLDAEHRSIVTSERLVLPPSARTRVAELTLAESAPAQLRYEYRYMLGDPDARHDRQALYRAPYAIGQAFRVTQAYPDSMTHRGPGAHATDFAMPQGTAVHAARDGTVVEIAYRSFRGGTTREDAERANLVRLLHDDGTFAVYAHLALNSVRVRPGERVRAGQYIASSGNTGFSSGPHLHFAVERNVGFAMQSLPVQFRGAGGAAARARSGVILPSR